MHVQPVSLRRRIQKSWYSYLMLAPYFVVFFVFTALPVGISIWNSLTYNNFFDPARFVGFDNYIRMFTGDDVFLIALRNTLMLALITGPVGYAMSFLPAWQINNMPSKLFRSIFTLLFYAPTMTTSVYTVWTLLFSNDEYGYINGVLMRLGFIREAIQWLADTDYMMTVVIICVLWTSMGAGFLSFCRWLSKHGQAVLRSGPGGRNTQPLARTVVYYAAHDAASADVRRHYVHYRSVFHW